MASPRACYVSKEASRVHFHHLTPESPASEADSMRRCLRCRFEDSYYERLIQEFT
jgi:hypothetical protein